MGLGGGLHTAARVFNFVKRERLYQKYVKKHNAALFQKERVTSADLSLAAKTQQKEELRQKVRDAKNDRQRKRARRAVAKKRKEIKRVQSRKNKREERFRSAVQDAVVTKNTLNVKEAVDDKTTAYNGTLQYLRKQRDKLAQGKIEQEDYEDIVASINEDMSDDYGRDIDIEKMLAPDHQTFDKEAKDLIGLVEEMKRTSEMNSTLSAIKNRYTETQTEDVIIEQYDDADIAQLEADVAANDTPENQQLLAQIKADRDRIKQEIQSKGAREL